MADTGDQPRITSKQLSSAGREPSLQYRTVTSKPATPKSPRSVRRQPTRL